MSVDTNNSLATGVTKRRSRTREFTIIAQDPSITDSQGGVLTAKITLPIEDLERGPMGSAVYIVDYDATAGKMYKVAKPPQNGTVTAPVSVHKLLRDPKFHALNAYAIVMRILRRFEFALGRRVSWGIPGHQLKVVPHAFEQANAYYNPGLEALLFGYVRGEPNQFMCLSHDVVAHETAHALLDGLRDKFIVASSPDQVALHEAFADIVALLSVFSLPEIPLQLLKLVPAQPNFAVAAGGTSSVPAGFIRRSQIGFDQLANSPLLGLADEAHKSDTRTDATRFSALRRSVTLAEDPTLLDSDEYQEEHRRGEVLVAVVMQAFLHAWIGRIDDLADKEPDSLLNLQLVADEGAAIADVMLTMAIRGIDYTPPIHVTFGDYVAAMLTADAEVRSDDTRFGIREWLRAKADAFGLRQPLNCVDWCLQPPPKAGSKLARSGAHLAGLQSDPVEVFRLIWNNRGAFDRLLNPHAYTRIASVRPCLRVSPDDGFHLRETVVECIQYLNLTVAELKVYGLHDPSTTGMKPEREIVLQGGATLILDEYGELKYVIANPLPRPDADVILDKSFHLREIAERWQRRLDWLWKSGYFHGDANPSARLAMLHAERQTPDQLTAFGFGAEADRNLHYVEECWL